MEKKTDNDKSAVDYRIIHTYTCTYAGSQICKHIYIYIYSGMNFA